MDILIGDLLFHPDYVKGVTFMRGLAFSKFDERAKPNDVPADGILAQDDYCTRSRCSGTLSFSISSSVVVRHFV